MKALRIFVTALFLMLIATSAFAASLSYSPDYTYVTIPAGSNATVPFTVAITDVYSGTYFLWFLDSADGSLPLGWITSAQRTTFLNRFWNTASTSLRIAVPEDAEPGTYVSYVYSKAMRSHEYAKPGNGMLIEVFVPASCSGAPVVEIASLSPEVIWPPNHDTEVVTVTGRIDMPGGCTLYEAGYSIEDEYGVYTGVGEFSVSDNGEFSVPLPVEAWREGQDKDGRIYKIKLFAENDAGIGTSDVLEAVVPHDKGKRPNAE